MTDAQTGQPLDGATVALTLSRERLRPRVTAVQGAYEASLPTRSRPQHLTVIASQPGYVAGAVEREVDATATALRVDVALTPEPQPPGPVSEGGGIRAARVTPQAPASRSFTFALQPGWNLIAFPLAPSNPDPAVIFGPLKAQGITTATLYHWTGSGYTVVQQVEPGRAYWLNCTAPTTLTVTGQPLADATLELAPGAAMVANPRLEPLPLSEVFVTANQQRRSLADAVQAGWVWAEYVTWNPLAYVASNPRSGYERHQVTPGTTLSLPPGQGVWMKALQVLDLGLGTAPPPPTDTTPPTGTIRINDGAARVGTPAVTLSLTATDASGTVEQMRIANGAGPYTDPEPFAPTKPWTLTGGDGQKTVCARFRDDAGQWSDPVCASTVLDTTPPVITVSSPRDGATFGR